MNQTETIRDRILHAVGQRITEKARRWAPADQGRLRQSIYYAVSGGTLTVGAHASHADQMEFGSPPRILSQSEKDALTQWTRRKNMGIAKMGGRDLSAGAVIRKIEKYGIEGSKYGGRRGTPYTESKPYVSPTGTTRPFLRPAIHQTLPELKGIIRKALA